MSEKGEKLLYMAASVFLILSVSVMVFVNRGAEAGETDEGTEITEPIREAYFEAVDGNEGDIIIPLPEGEAGTQYHIEEKIGAMELEVILGPVEEEFFHQNKIRGNEDKIRQVLCLHEKEKTSLVFNLRHIYESEAAIQDGMLYLKLEDPVNQYDRIVVLAGESGAWQEEAKNRLQEKKIKGFSSGDVAMANELHADFFVGFEQEPVRRGEGGEIPAVNMITICYNDDYFIPDFDSGDLAAFLYEYYSQETDWEIRLVKSSDPELLEAMIPGVKVVYNLTESTGDSPQLLAVDALIGKYEEMEEER
ncbi:MAG: hypothetical protein J1E61_10870 [Lachnospiraceae bacterium]|nr:hypothetical protein [Lachnospiraceae bacterium]